MRSKWTPYRSQAQAVALCRKATGGSLIGHRLTLYVPAYR
jgi:hypothetical protein